MGEQEPGGLVPPYEGRQTEAAEGHDEQMDKVFDRVDEVPPGPGREVSDEEREGVPATDTEATSALGVGESINRHGEDVARQEDEEGREDAGTQGRVRPPGRRLRRARLHLGRPRLTPPPAAPTCPPATRAASSRRAGRGFGAAGSGGRGARSGGR